MKLVIQFFQSEFDALQLSVKRFGEIPPSGDFDDFWWLLWLLTSEYLVSNFGDYGGLNLHSLEFILALVVFPGKLLFGRNLIKTCAIQL